MDPFEALRSQTPEIEAKLGYFFKDKRVLALAFVHRSFVNENRAHVAEHNERLEFLGDSVLGLLVSDYLFRYLPETPEGELSHLRSRIVEASSCILYSQQLDLEPYLLLGKGEQMNPGRGRNSILADLFEAVIGAIYLDGGLEAAKGFFFRNFSRLIEETMKKPQRNNKADLQDFSQKKYHETPRYEILEESGPDHQKSFQVGVFVNGELAGTGLGNSKKAAQQEAAADALRKIELEEL